MTKINRINKFAVLMISAFIFFTAGFFIMPARADAFGIEQLVDPFCFFLCDDKPRKHSSQEVVDIPIQNPTVSLSANPSSVSYNGSSTIYWNSSNATSCNASGGSSGWAGGKSLSGTFYTGALTNTTTYYITCSNSAGSSTSQSVTIGVGSIPIIPIQPVLNPTVILSADDSVVNYNGVTNIRWFTNNATACIATGGSFGWAGPKSIGPGTFYTGSLTSDKTYSITCSNNYGSAADSITVNVRRRATVAANPKPVSPPPPTSLVLITSSVDRNQAIGLTVNNTKPRPGEEISYTAQYQNIGTGTITGIILQIVLPQEVDYIFSNGSNPTVFGNTLVFNLGTLGANSQGRVIVKARVRDNISSGTNLNFLATLSYINPSGQFQSVNASALAQVWSDEPVINGQINTEKSNSLGANVFGAGFLPVNIFGWLLLFILVLLLILIAKYLFGPDQFFPFRKKTTTITTTH